MPELRKDPIIDRWALIAEDRARRPNEFRREGDGKDTPTSERCPFCFGNEADTPAAVYEKLDDQGRWTVRVVPNKYPAVTEEAEDSGQETGYGNQSLLVCHPASGVHEVIIESPRHIVRIAELGVHQLADVLAAWRARIAHWRRDGRFVCPVLFKNVGLRSGASLAHVHSQLMVLPHVPRGLSRELTAATDYFDRNESCIYCDLIAGERDAESRIVFDDDHFIAFAAFAGRQAYETWLLPTQHAADFDAINDNLLAHLAQSIYRLILAIETIQERPAYNLILHTKPFDINVSDRYHWHVELVPRNAQFAGFEIGSEEFIQSVSPERAAVTLRNVLN